jgi:capsular exopolysaccharide synthesis family protein
MEEQFQNGSLKTEVVGLTFKELLFKYIRFLPFFVISLALSLLIGYLYLRYTTPSYKSSGALVVKPEEKSSGGGGGSDRFQEMFSMDNSINVKNEIEIIKSRQLIKRIVEDLNLNYTYYVKGKIKESNIYNACPFRIETKEIEDSTEDFNFKVHIVNNVSFKIDDEDKVIRFGQYFETDYGIFRLVYTGVTALSSDYRILWHPTDVSASQLSSNLQVAPGGAAGIIQMSFEASNPYLAADVINEIMKEYQVATREDKNETNRRMLDFIDGRLKGVESELDSVTGSMIAYQKENNLIDAEVQSGSYFSRVEMADEELKTLKVQENFAQIIEGYLREGKNAYTLVPSSLGITDATLSTMISAYNVAQLERKALIDANVPVGNPRVEQIRDGIERLRVNILESLRNFRKSLNASINQMELTKSNANAQIRQLPAKQQRLIEIKTQQETKQTVYNLLLEKREQTAITLAGTISSMKVIEEAEADPIPVKPDPTNVLLISAVIGLAFPSLIIFIKELFNDKINTREDVEKITTVPIVGEIGHSFDKEPLVVRPNHRGLVAEQFRILRSNLQYVLNKIDKPVIMVTSSFSGEGKSYVSTNLGAVMALANKKTIILELDIRKPKILSHLNISKKPGIINYILGKVKLEELPIPVEGCDNFFVMACGPIPPNPAEILLDQKLNELFNYLKQNFEVIIIDTAPIGMVSDAMTLSKFADATLYIVRQSYTSKKQVLSIDEFHNSGKIPKISILLNDVKIRTGYGYYGYGRYGYGYGYGQKSGGYYGEEKRANGKMSSWFGWMDMKKWDRKKDKV